MAKLLTRFGGVDNGKAAPLVAMAKPQAVTAKLKPDVVADLIDDTQIEQGDGGYPVTSGRSNWRIQLAATPSRAGASELQEKYAPWFPGSCPAQRAKSRLRPRVAKSIACVFRRQGFGCRKQGLRAAQAPANRLPGYSELGERFRSD
ncbi:hypothetical protein VXQ18_06030 [Brucella abortus]|nr:hypothetical protein [Brucella abortus]